MPSVISNAGFLYPLSMSGAKDGMYFTDGTDTSGLTALFENSGYTVTDQRQRLSLPALAAKLLTDSVLSRAISAAMLGLIFCFSYVVLTVYREMTAAIKSIICLDCQKHGCSSAPPLWRWVLH